MTEGYVDPVAYGWYVTDPSTGLIQYVEADAECTARWIAWRRWRGAMPADEREEAEYAVLEVVAAGKATEPVESGDIACALGDEHQREGAAH